MKSADYLRVMGAAPLLVALFFIMEHIGFPRLFTLSCIGISLWYIKNYEELTLAAWVQMMLSTVVEIFFREIDVLDKHKIPETGENFVFVFCITCNVHKSSCTVEGAVVVYARRA